MTTSGAASNDYFQNDDRYIFQRAVFSLVNWLNVARCTQELITTFSYFLCCTPGTYKFRVYNKENMKTLHRWLCGRPNNRYAGDAHRFHDIAMTWTLWRLRPPTTRPFVQHLDAANNKENIKSSVSVALYKGGIHQWPLDFPHKGKLFHVMTPSWCERTLKRIHHIMMTSSNEDMFRITSPLCGEFTGPRWIPRTKASDAELWCFLWYATG